MASLTHPRFTPEDALLVLFCSLQFQHLPPSLPDVQLTRSPELTPTPQLPHLPSHSGFSFPQEGGGHSLNTCKSVHQSKSRDGQECGCYHGERWSNQAQGLPGEQGPS